VMRPGSRARWIELILIVYASSWLTALVAQGFAAAGLSLTLAASVAAAIGLGLMIGSLVANRFLGRGP